MKTILTIIISVLTLSLQAQNNKTKELIKSIEGQYQLDERGEVAFTYFIEMDSIPKETLYNASLLVLRDVYDGIGELNINDATSQLLVASGEWKKVYEAFALTTESVDAKHQTRINTVDGKVTVTIALQKMVFSETGKYGKTEEFSMNEIYPMNPSGKKKNVIGRAFYNSYSKSMQLLVAIEKGLKQSPLLPN
ncbi:hypothetical protein [Ekhidna sp.]